MTITFSLPPFCSTTKLNEDLVKQWHWVQSCISIIMVLWCQIFTHQIFKNHMCSVLHCCLTQIESLIYTCSSSITDTCVLIITQTLWSTDKEVEDLSAGTTISCLLLVEGTLQSHHTWPRPVCLCNPYNIWDLFSWQYFLIWLTFRSNNSFWRAGRLTDCISRILFRTQVLP